MDKSEFSLCGATFRVSPALYLAQDMVRCWDPVNTVMNRLVL
jgi:hypothetical protein